MGGWQGKDWADLENTVEVGGVSTVNEWEVTIVWDEQRTLLGGKV